MINKFQQGGKLDAIMLFVLGLALTLQADPLQVIQIAQLNPEALQNAVQVYQLTLDMGQAAQAFQLTLQLKTKAMKHGAKLQYLKSLKNKCADDEELYYYKKGGSVGCGCKKKEDGGEVTKALKGCSAVEKFKAIRKGSTGYKNDNDEWTTYDPKLRKTRKMTPLEIAKAKKNQLDAREGKGEGDYIQPPANKSERTTRREEPEEPKVTRPKSVNKPIKPIRRDSAKTSLQKCGGRVKKAECGVVAKFKAAKCGAKMKKHQLGGSLNSISFYLRGTNEGGIKSDNTKVAKIPSNGEGIYERTPQGIGDFLPIVGTIRAALRIDRNEPNASYGDLIMNGAFDALGTGMVGSVIKAAGKASKLAKLLKSRGYFKITDESPQWFKVGSKEIPIEAGKFGTIGYNKGPAVYTRTIPEVDYTNAVMAPLVQTVRVPATASFK